MAQLQELVYVIQASDRLEGEFTEQDEANLVRLPGQGGHMTNQRQFRHLGITPRIARLRLARPRWSVRVMSVVMSRA